MQTFLFQNYFFENKTCLSFALASSTDFFKKKTPLQRDRYKKLQAQIYGPYIF